MDLREREKHLFNPTLGLFPDIKKHFHRKINKEKVLKAIRKNDITYNQCSIRFTVNFSSETMGDIKNRMAYSKC